MSPLLEQFLSEARDFLQGIGEKLMELEDAPADIELMTSLFRMVHTLKGNSGLFEFPEMTRVLHAGEDLMDAVRHGRVGYSKELADRLLDAMDFVGMLCDEIEAKGGIGATHAANSARLAESLRQLIATVEGAAAVGVAAALIETVASRAVADEQPLPLADIPEDVRMMAFRQACAGAELHWLDYVPAEECFFQGDDPFFQARGTPGVLSGSISARQSWPQLADLDAYRCVLDFHLLSAAPRAELDEYYRYMPDQVRMRPVSSLSLVLPAGDPNGGPVYEDFVVDAIRLLDAGQIESLGRNARALLELSSPHLWLSSALRWLLLLMELAPEKHKAFGALIESLRHLTAPRWADHELDGAANSAASATVVARMESSLTPEEALTMQALIAVQRDILSLPVAANWQLGRLKGVAATLAG